MPRGNGSYLGTLANPTPNSAGGIWRVREAEEYLRANKWPARPSAPGSPGATAGNGQVSLTWTALTLGSSPTDYDIQYSDNGGATWTTFSDGVSSATSATVTGLTNGTAYVFRVAAKNTLGYGPYGNASAPVTPSAVSPTLLLHFDGTNGSTEFLDSSANNLSFSANENAIVSTTESKFGGASLYCDGNASGITAPDSDNVINFQDGDFTIEAWVYPLDNGVYSVIGQMQSSGQHSFGFYLLNGRPYIVVATPVGGEWGLQGGMSAAAPLNEWSHIALVRHQNNIALYLNGTGELIGQFSGSFHNSSVDIRIGWNLFNQHFYGYIDELRIVKGTAVYTANFSPPNAPFA